MPKGTIMAFEEEKDEKTLQREEPLHNITPEEVEKS